MLLPTKGVQHTKNKHLDNLWWTTKKYMLPFYAKTPLPPQPHDKTFTILAERRGSEVAKTHLGVDIAGSSLFDAIGHLRPLAPSAPNQNLYCQNEAPFKFISSTNVNKPSAILKTLSPTKKHRKTV